MGFLANLPHASFSLWAVHISDGVLTGPWLVGGFVGAVILALSAVLIDWLLGWLGRRRFPEEEIAQMALLTAVFFVASLVHVKLGPTSVHLLLNGLLGVVLGWRVALAVPVGLFLQAVLIGHGGFTALGINSCIMVIPGLLAWGLFAGLQRLPWIRQPWFRGLLVFISILAWTLSLVFSITLLCTNRLTTQATLDTEWAARLTWHPVTVAAAVVAASLATWTERRLENAPEFPLGLVVGELAVVATSLLNCLVLLWGGQEDWHTLALGILVAHLPIAVIEGIITGFTVGFLVRVKPEMIGWVAPPERTACSVEPLP
jgi:cobalt/nickel transport system permease protein